jgi:hypothetical protein
MRTFCQESTPLILVSSINEKIVGLAPLQLRKNLFFRNAAFLLPYEHSPDFVVIDEYREEVLGNFLNIIVKKIKCKQIVLDLPAESQNLPCLERVCRHYKIKFGNQLIDKMSHCVISVQGSLDEFEKSQGRKIKKGFRRISRNFDKMGAWKIMLIDDWRHDRDVQDAFDKMMAIEKMSWKEKWRLQNTGSTIDKGLQWIWNSSLLAAKTNPDFKHKIGFLELNGQAIAYELFIEYGGTAFFTKTSYDEKYGRLYPGIFVCNVLIEEQFRRQQVETIDLLTNLSYMKTWKVTCLPRVRFTLNEADMSNLFGVKLIALLNRFWRLIEYRKI